MGVSNSPGYATPGFSKLVSDHTGSTTSVSNTEVTLSVQKTISAGSASKLMIHVVGDAVITSNANDYLTIRLRVGNNATATSNDAIVSNMIGNNGSVAGGWLMAFSVNCMVEDADFTGDFSSNVYVDVTGQRGVASANNVYIRSVTILGSR